MGAIADKQGRVNYSFRRAYETNAFHQFPLIGISKLCSEARERGIQCSAFSSTLLGELEPLDREGAFSPILFETWDADGGEVIVFCDERDYLPWTEYAASDGVTVAPRPFYSPWQLLYLNDAIELPKASVSLEWLLDDERRQVVNPVLRDFWGVRLDTWRTLHRGWRDLLLVLVRLQSCYGPSVKGTLTKSTVSLVRHPGTGELVDPRELEPSFEAQRVLEELGLALEDLKAMHQRLASHGMRDDPLRYWHMLFRMAPFKQRARLRGVARRAQDAYDAAEMLRRFYFDLTDELLLNPDDIYDVSDKSWKKRLFGEWPTLGYTRADLAVELRLRDLHPYQVHIVVEGDTEQIVCRRVLEEVAGMPLEDMGVTIHRLHGVGGASQQQEMLRAIKTFPRYVILVADREGAIEGQVALMKRDGVLTDETSFLWDTSFEEANFSDQEIVDLIATIGADSGATLALDAETLRTLYGAHRAKAGKQAKAVAAFTLALALQPAYGGVVVSKKQLAERMAVLILDDLRERGAEVVSKERPIVSVLIAVFRAT
ncbi:MAG: hypothetical protein IT201_02025 [Thermoleophilia bacterium]|nr:hypothetical protein [Thermoleophilia bacterium]